MYCNGCKPHLKNYHDVCCDQCNLCNPKLTKGLIQNLKDKIINLQNESIKFKFAKRPIKKKQKDYYYLMLRKLNGLDRKIQNLESLFLTHFDHTSDDLSNNICSEQSCEYFEFYDSVRSLIELANQLKEELSCDKQNVHCNYEYTSQLCNHIKLLELEIRGLSSVLEHHQNPDATAQKHYYSRLEHRQNNNKLHNGHFYHDYCMDDKCPCSSENLRAPNKRWRQNQIYGGDVKCAPPIRPYYFKNKNARIDSPNSVPISTKGSCRSNFSNQYNYQVINKESVTSSCSCNICRNARNKFHDNPECTQSNSCCSFNTVRCDNKRYEFTDCQNPKRNIHYINSPKHVEFIDFHSHNKRGGGKRKIRKPFSNQYNSTETFLVEENIFTSNDQIQVSDFKKRKVKTKARNVNPNGFPVSQLTSTDGIILKHMIRRNKKRKYKSKLKGKVNNFQENNISLKSNSRILKDVVYYELSPRYNHNTIKIKSKEEFKTNVHDDANVQNSNKLNGHKPNKGSHFKRAQAINYTLQTVKPHKKHTVLNNTFNEFNNNPGSSTSFEINNKDSWSDDHKLLVVTNKYNIDRKYNRPQEKKPIEFYKTTEPLYKTEFQHAQLVRVEPKRKSYYQPEISKKHPNFIRKKWKYTQNHQLYKTMYNSYFTSDDNNGFVKNGSNKKYNKNNPVNESDSYETIHSINHLSDSSSSEKINRSDNEELIIFLKNNNMSSALKQSELGKIIKTLSEFKNEYCDNCIVQEKRIQLSSQNLSLNNKMKTNVITKKEIIKCTQCRNKLEEKLLNITKEGERNDLSNETEHKIMEKDVAKKVATAPNINKSTFITEEYKHKRCNNNPSQYKTNSDVWEKSTVIPTYQTKIQQETLFPNPNNLISESKNMQDASSVGNTINININKGFFPFNDSQHDLNKQQEITDTSPDNELGNITKNNKNIVTGSNKFELQTLKNTNDKPDVLQNTLYISEIDSKKKNKVVFNGITTNINPSSMVINNELGETVNETEVNNQLYDNEDKLKEYRNNGDLKTSNILLNPIVKEVPLKKQQKIYNITTNKDEHAFNATTEDNCMKNLISIKKKQKLSDAKIIQVPQQKINIDCQYKNVHGYHKSLPLNQFQECHEGNKDMEINYLYGKPDERNNLHLLKNINAKASKALINKSLPLKLHSQNQKDNFKHKTSVVFNVSRKNSKPFKHRYRGQAKCCNNSHSLKVIKEPELRKHFGSNYYNGIVSLTVTSESSIGVLDWLKIAGKLKDDSGILLSNHLND